MSVPRERFLCFSSRRWWETIPWLTVRCTWLSPYYLYYYSGHPDNILLEGENSIELFFFNFFLALKHPKVVAIGEFGLDDIWCKDSKTVFANQEKVFKQHIKLALKTKKPMVLHLRGPNSLGKLNGKNIYRYNQGLQTAFNIGGSKNHLIRVHFQNIGVHLRNLVCLAPLNKKLFWKSLIFFSFLSSGGERSLGINGT